jgi:hypothetical protein
VAPGLGEPEGNGVEATRFPFPLPGATIGEQKAKVKAFLFFLSLHLPIFPVYQMVVKLGRIVTAKFICVMQTIAVPGLKSIKRTTT